MIRVDGAGAETRTILDAQYHVVRYCVSQSQFAGAPGSPRAEWQDGIVPDREIARYRPRRCATSMMAILWVQVYKLCRVDRSIRIAVSTVMDIPTGFSSS